MADIRNENRSGGRTDVERRPRTEREMPSERGLQRTDIGRDPFTLMNSLHREMERLFDDFGFGGGLLHGPRLWGETSRELWSPQVEVFEKDGKLHVCADLPGLSKDDVKVEVLDDNLTIEGERKSEKRDERGGWSERSYGHFFRSIPLPEGVNAEKAKASFENGVLDITFDAPRLEQKKGKAIPIGK